MEDRTEPRSTIDNVRLGEGASDKGLQEKDGGDNTAISPVLGADLVQEELQDDKLENPPVLEVDWPVFVVNGLAATQIPNG